MSARILERAAACVWQASRRLLTGYRLTGAIDPFAYRTLAGATAWGTPALERMAKGTLRLVREAELELALARAKPELPPPKVVRREGRFGEGRSATMAGLPLLRRTGRRAKGGRRIWEGGVSARMISGFRAGREALPRWGAGPWRLGNPARRRPVRAAPYPDNEG